MYKTADSNLNIGKFYPFTYRWGNWGLEESHQPTQGRTTGNQKAMSEHNLKYVYHFHSI